MQENMLVLEQRQVLSAKQVQSLEILTYTNQELEDFLLNEYLENPMLENTLDKQNDMINDLEHLYEKGASYKDYYIQWDDDDDNRRNDIRAKAPDELKDSLLNQLHSKDYSDAEWKLLGYQEKTISKCLKVLKDLEPVGIFFGDISECLRKQLFRKGIYDNKLFLMVEHNLSDILEGRFKEKLERARFIVNCVEQRRNTIVKIVEAILAVQEDYFINDKELRPMSMVDIAGLTGLHVSTVSKLSGINTFSIKRWF